MMDVMSGLLIPFAGTSLGAACVLFVRKEMNAGLQRALTGFAAGVMVAASVWSLLLPALSQASYMGKWSFIPAVVGFWVGILFLFLLDNVIPHLHSDTEQAEGPQANLKKTTMLVLADTSQHSRGNGCGSRVCRICERKFRYNSYVRDGTCGWNSDTELS